MLRAKNLLQIYSARNLWQEGAQREHPKVKLLLTKSHLKASNSCSTVDFRYSKADRAAPKHPNWRRREIVVFSFTKIMPTSAFCSGIENNRWSLSCTCSPFLSVKTWWLVIYTRLLEYKTRLFSKFPGLSCSPASTHPEVALGGGTDSTMHWGAYTLSAFQIIWKSWGGGGVTRLQGIAPSEPTNVPLSCTRGQVCEPSPLEWGVLESTLHAKKHVYRFTYTE